MARLDQSSKLYVGSILAKKLYIGSQLVWQEEQAPTPDTPFWFSFNGVPGNYLNTNDAYGVPFNTVSLNALLYASQGKDNTACISIPTGSGGGYAQWNNSTPVTSASIGFWFKPGTVSDVDARIFDFRETPSSGTVGGVLWTPEGRFRIMQTTSGLATGQSPTLSAGVWYWISLYWNATTKIARLTVHDATGTSLHDSGNVALTTSYTQFTTTRIGRVTTSNIGLSYIDMFLFDPGATAVIAPWIGSSNPVPLYPSDTLYPANDLYPEG